VLFYFSFQMILPKVWPANGKRPVCIHLAGTGDHVCVSVCDDNCPCVLVDVDAE